MESLLYNYTQSGPALPRAMQMQSLRLASVFYLSTQTEAHHMARSLALSMERIPYSSDIKKRQDRLILKGGPTVMQERHEGTGRRASSRRTNLH